MTDTQDLNRRFANTKNHIIMCDDRFAEVEPTDKEVWLQMKLIATQNMIEAVADDLEAFVISYQKRIQLIDEQLKPL